MPWQCRMAPSLGSLENTPEEVWGTKPYNNRREPVVFFGLYDLRDYIALFRHKGEKAILWAGGDIENLIRGFAFSDGKLKWFSKTFKGLPWAFRAKIKQIPNYVENEPERTKLEQLGISSKVVPSFLGKIEDFPLCYKPAIKYKCKNCGTIRPGMYCFCNIDYEKGEMSGYKEIPDKPNVFISGHPGREREYGFDLIERIARRIPECAFHLYGAEWRSGLDNVFCHGKVPKEQFNREIRNYQASLRPNTHDGFSEITAKSILMGQWPITRIKYPHINYYTHEDELIGMLQALKFKKHPNYEGRAYYIKTLNQYPWNDLLQ